MSLSSRLLAQHLDDVEAQESSYAEQQREEEESEAAARREELEDDGPSTPEPIRRGRGKFCLKSKSMHKLDAFGVSVYALQQNLCV